MRRFYRALHRGLLASIDQGTSSSRVILYDAGTLKPVASHQVQLADATTTPSPGWSQMDPIAIVSSVEECTSAVLQKAGATASDIIGVGITNQRETTVVWDKTTGRPLYDAVLWHDARTRDTVQSLQLSLGGQDALRGVCGLPISTYFSGVKLRWLCDNVPAVKAAIADGKALFGTVDSWLIWNLTGGASGVGSTTRHVTDITNASRTMMMDLADGRCAAFSFCGSAVCDIAFDSMYNIAVAHQPSRHKSSHSPQLTDDRFARVAIEHNAVGTDPPSKRWGLARHSMHSHK